MKMEIRNLRPWPYLKLLIITMRKTLEKKQPDNIDNKSGHLVNKVISSTIKLERRKISNIM